nr:zinc finger protein castor homolog 1 isoform X9 [Chrysemys picta bellii]
MKVDYLSEFGFRLSDYAERSICTDATSGKSKMAAKRKGGLKLNAICAKLSRQVVFDHGGSEQVRLDKGPQRESGNKEPPQPETKELGAKFSDGLNRVQKIEEDKRREVIEKWVNGEYNDETLLGRAEGKECKATESVEVPPEGVYMVQPKGCSDEEDNGDDADGSFPDDRDSDGPASKDESYRPSSGQTGSKLAGGAASGEASSLRDYAATTMNEFLGMFGYNDQNMRDELTRKISFDKLNAATSEASSATASLPGEDAMSKRARFSKYEEYIRKLKAGEQLSWPIHPAKSEDLSSKLGKEASSVLTQPIRALPGPDATLLTETKATILPLPSPSSSQMQGLMSRASKYDFFIQKLKTGESIRPQNGNTYKKTSKYDLENVKYLHLFKPGEGSPDMGGAIAFKTGKVGRPSKYDVRNIQKLTPVKAPTPSLAPNPLASTPSSAPVAGPEQPVSLPFNTPEYLKSTFSKTDSITTGTVSTVKNGLPTDKPAVTEDVNIYQKYIARFSGSQHCGHIHCAYQYREHYHCLDPECNYQRFTSKQDVIRHYNMHKKRDNSLQHGFMRFSPLDDCSVYYHGCHLNGKSTHYHCMQVGCNKVYTSTSDVMTHENFHKKNTQLINDGFQRFRATEDCGTVDCQFYGQKTTHFHCRERATDDSRPVQSSSNEAGARGECGILIPGNPGFLAGAQPGPERERSWMNQANASLGSLPSLKTEGDGNQAGAGEPTQYLGKAVKALVQEKLSEPWKMYLRRFGTKDFCDAHCDFLHKVHFHCVVEECGALFSTLDGAIKHANFHFRTEGGAVKGNSESPFPSAAETKTSLAPSSPSTTSITMASAPTLDVPTPSPATVPSAPTLLAWKQLASTIPQMPQIPALVPNLATSPLATTSLENAKPQVKPGFLQFQENDPCLATDCKYANKFHFHCLFGNCKYVCKTSGKAESHCLDHINPNNNLVNVRDQFAYYSLQCLCPNQHCEFRMRGHYHCLRPGCYFVTNITTKLPWHVKKHEKAERRAANGFKYFTKREECGRLGCKYNQVNSHFHCIREGCQFSFLLKHQMTSHARKHMRRMLGKNFDRVPTQVIGHTSRNENLPHVGSMAPSPASSGTPASFQGPQSMMDTETDEYMDYTGCSPGGISSESSNMDRSCSSTPVGNESTSAGCLVPPPPPTAAAADDATHNAPQPPPPPLPPSFSQALLRSPLPSLPYLFSPSCLSYSLLSATLGSSRGIVMPATSTPAFSPIIATPTPVKSDVPLVQDAAGNTITMPTASGAKKRFWIIEDMSPFGKRRKTASSRKMLDEGMMLEGFRRYDLYEDCKDTNCQFSLKVTHYHCTRENCGYKFCGRTHMYKHAQHHDRVDNLVLDDFKRFKSSLSCNFPDCQFSGNSTHFHCLRCGFRCTDSTKVTAHRKHHGKQDVISAAGFCQFSSSVDCEVPDCKYKLKCSHFHCTYPGCKHTVVGMSQMDSHKRKHEKQERGELPAISPGPEGLHHSTLEYDVQNSSVNLDSSLNLSTDANSSLFFLQNAAGVGLNDSLDLSKKLPEAAAGPSPSRAGTSPHESGVMVSNSGDVEDEDDSSQDEDEEEEEINEEEDDDDEDDDDDDDDEDEEEDLNTDSEESLPDPEGLATKEDGETGEASTSIDHGDASRPLGEPNPDLTSAPTPALDPTLALTPTHTLAPAASP